MDCVHIKNLEIFARHGVFEAENQLGQLFVVSAKLYLDTYKAGISDNLELSVHYGEVCHLIKQEMESKTFKLIEAAAEHLARKILMTYPLVQEIELTLDKPWAPIGLHLDCAGVTIHRKRHHAWVAVGSNIGNSREIISGAMQKLEEFEDIEIKAQADLIVTPPYGVTDQPDFLNGCIEIETFKEPEELLETLLSVEKLFGRERKIHWGPRTLDLDIIFYDNMVISTKHLCVPHPDMANRAFVLEPLNQIAGWYMHPLKHKTVSQLYHELTMEG